LRELIADFIPYSLDKSVEQTPQLSDERVREYLFFQAASSFLAYRENPAGNLLTSATKLRIFDW